MKLYFKCPCCCEKKFIINKTSVGNLCESCWIKICNLNNIQDYIILFYAKHNISLKEVSKYWSTSKKIKKEMEK